MQEQDRERAVRSLNQAGASTSAQMLLNVKSDFGSEDGGSLHAQGVLHPENGHARLSKVNVVSAQNSAYGSACIQSAQRQAAEVSYACMHMWLRIWRFVSAW